MKEFFFVNLKLFHSSKCFFKQVDEEGFLIADKFIEHQVNELQEEKLKDITRTFAASCMKEVEEMARSKIKTFI